MVNEVKPQLDMLELRMETLAKIIIEMGLEVDKLDTELVWWQTASIVLGISNIVGWGIVVWRLF